MIYICEENKWKVISLSTWKFTPSLSYAILYGSQRIKSCRMTRVHSTRLHRFTRYIILNSCQFLFEQILRISTMFYHFFITFSLQLTWWKPKIRLTCSSGVFLSLLQGNQAFNLQTLVEAWCDGARSVDFLFIFKNFWADFKIVHQKNTISCEKILLWWRKSRMVLIK